MKIAFYRGTHAGLPGVYNRLVRWWDHSDYSHCELVFSDGMSGSASYMDGGVRLKQIDYAAERWDFVDVPAHLEPAARQWFEQHAGEKYDLLGNVHFVFALIRHASGRWFCSEAVAEALGMVESWRYKPGDLYSALSWKGRQAA